MTDTKAKKLLKEYNGGRTAKEIEAELLLKMHLEAIGEKDSFEEIMNDYDLRQAIKYQA